MKGPVAFMARNHVAANLLMLLLVVGGLFTVGTIKQEVFPDIRPGMVNVMVAYPGATPAEVEDALVLPIELAVSEVDYIKRIRSTARENVATVSIELIDEDDIDVALQEVKAAVDRIRTFPREVERPIISKQARRNQVVNVYVYGTASERALLELAESVRDDLIAFPEITIVQIAGNRPYEISIEIPEDLWFDCPCGEHPSHDHREHQQVSGHGVAGHESDRAFHQDSPFSTGRSVSPWAAP